MKIIEIQDGTVDIQDVTVRKNHIKSIMLGLKGVETARNGPLLGQNESYGLQEAF